MQAREVLRRLEWGQLDVREAARLLEGERRNLPRSRRTRKARWVRIQVRQSDEGRDLNLRLPAALLRACLRLLSLAVLLIPERSWRRWVPASRSCQDGGELMLSRHQLAAALTGLGRSAVSGAGVEVSDQADRFAVCFE